MGKRKSNLTGLAKYVFEVSEPSSSLPASTSTSQGALAQEMSTQSTPIRVDRSGSTINDSDSLETRPTKRVKLGLLGPGLEKFDATGLVPFYTHVAEVPPHLQKYFSQRERYFSMYDSGCLLDEEGWYSVTPEGIAEQIAERCRCNVILDAFCGVGGNAIAFARTCERVIALDISPIRLAIARHNAALYGVEDRIEFVLADFFSFARTLKQRKGRKIDVIFLSPPWGGPSYLSNSPSKKDQSKDGAEETCADFSLESIRPVHGAELFKVARGITRNVAYYLPRNTSLDEISILVVDGNEVRSSGGLEKVEVEEDWMGSKLKALTCYFGGLVAGQESLFNG